MKDDYVFRMMPDQYSVVGFDPVGAQAGGSSEKDEKDFEERVRGMVTKAWGRPHLPQRFNFMLNEKHIMIATKFLKRADKAKLVSADDCEWHFVIVHDYAKRDVIMFWYKGEPNLPGGKLLETAIGDAVKKDNVLRPRGGFNKKYAKVLMKTKLQEITERTNADELIRTKLREILKLRTPTTSKYDPYFIIGDETETLQSVHVVYVVILPVSVNKQPTFFILPPLKNNTSYFVIFYIREEYNPDTFAPVKMAGVLARAHMHPEHSVHLSHTFLQNAAKYNSAIDSRHFQNGGATLEKAIIQKISEQRESETLAGAKDDFEADEPDAEGARVLAAVPDDMMHEVLADGEIIRALQGEADPNPNEDGDEEMVPAPADVMDEVLADGKTSQALQKKDGDEEMVGMMPDDYDRSAGSAIT